MEEQAIFGKPDYGLPSYLEKVQSQLPALQLLMLFGWQYLTPEETVQLRGGKEGKIRETVIRENLLDAVIGLPANLFYGTGITAALMIFDKSRKPNGKGKVFFIDAGRDIKRPKLGGFHGNGNVDLYQMCLTG